MQQTEMYPPASGGSEGALQRYPLSATVKDEIAHNTIEAVLGGKMGKMKKKKMEMVEAALAQIAMGIKLEPLEFRRRSSAAQVRAQVVQVRGGDGAQVWKALLDEWHDIEALAADAVKRGVLSRPQQAAVLVQLLTDATKMLPAGDSLAQKVVGEFRRKANEADPATF